MSHSDHSHKILDKLSKVDTIYLFEDVYTHERYQVHCPSLLPDVITITDGMLDKPNPFETLVWRIIVCTPILLGLYHIKMENVFIALCVLLVPWLTVSVRTFILCICLQHSYDLTVIIPDGGNQYERD